jgi:hypothetical protein
MKVYEAIEKLKEFDPQKELTVYNEDTFHHERVESFYETTRPDSCPCCPDVPVVCMSTY